MSESVDRLVSSFRAVVAQEIGKYRLQDPGDKGTIDAFVRDLRVHELRYGQKLSAIRFTNPALKAEADACEAQLRRIVNDEAARAYTADRVEYAP